MIRPRFYNHSIKCHSTEKNSWRKGKRLIDKSDKSTSRIKNDHLEVWTEFLSIFLSCCRIIFSLSWFTCALGIFELETYPYRADGWLSEMSTPELLRVILFLLENWEAFWLWFPMASATSLMGRLRAARYYFLDSTPLEWYWLISSINFSSSSSNLCNSFLSYSFFLPTSMIVWACSVYMPANFSFQYCIYFSLACCDYSATFRFFSLCTVRNSRSISFNLFVCSIDMFLTSLASSNLTR